MRTPLTTAASLLIALGCGGALAAETVLVEAGSAMSYRANASNPGIGLSWTLEGFNASGWTSGAYGVGYETATGAENLIRTPVPAGTYSIYTRAAFTIADASEVTTLFLGADYDDGYAAWINGIEVFRSSQLPSGTLAWNTAAALHESGNGQAPSYAPLVDISARAIPALHDGVNILAVGVWNAAPSSTDLVVVPRLSMNQGVAVTRGPYLQMGTPTSVVVRWRTNFAVESCVRYGAAPGSLTLSSCSPAPTTEHAVEVSGLFPDSLYYYSVGTTGETFAGDDTEHFFVTSPSAGTSKPTRVWVLGDSGTADANARAVRDAFLAGSGPLPADLWLMLGDNAYEDGTDDEFQAAVFDMYPDMLRKAVLWPTLGNHDGHTANSATQSGPYYDIFTLPASGEAGGLPSGPEAYYSFDYGDIHFICLESYETDRSPGGAMMTWLAEDIAGTLQPWIIAFWHHPPYSKGSHDSDVDVELMDMRENALPILEANGVDLVLGGHSHSYERTFLLDGHYGPSSTFTQAMKKDGGSGREDGTGAYEKPTAGKAPHEGAVYVVAGSSGQTSGGSFDHPAMYISLMTLGSLVLDVDGQRLDAQFLDSAGIRRDYFTVLKGSGQPPGTIDSLATGETPVAGTRTGSFVNTQNDDLVYQVIQETVTGGKPSTRQSFLEHRWTFDVQAGASVTFHVKGYQTPSADGDHFAFAYSTDGATYTDMLVLTKTADDGQYLPHDLPPSLSGRVYVRVRDTNRAAGARSKDAVHVDHLFIRTVR